MMRDVLERLPASDERTHMQAFVIRRNRTDPSIDIGDSNEREHILWPRKGRT